QRDDQGDDHQHGGDQVQVLGLQPDEIAVQREGDEEAVDDRPEYDCQGHVEDAPRRQDAFADDHRRQADDDGADTHGDVGAALGLGEHGAGQRHQGVGDGHAEDDHGTGVDALGAGHARVGAGRADGQALTGGEVEVEQNLGSDHHHQQDQRPGHVVAQPLGLQNAEHGRFHDQRNVGPTHDAQVDRV